MELVEGTPAYEKFLEPLLRQLEAHLVAKGWIDDAYIGIDEVPPERLSAPREFMKRVAPRLKFAVASNVDPLRYRNIERDTDVFSQILWKGGHGIESIFGPEYEAFMDARRKAGRITTFYVCTEPQKPNTWLCSPLAESEWIGLYAAAKRYDGFLRWACVLWPQDAYDFTRKGITSMPAGERTLLYPGGLASPRWELLRDGIEDWEKIRLLREKGALPPALESALAALDWESLQSETEAETRAKVAAVLSALDSASAAKAE